MDSEQPTTTERPTILIVDAQTNEQDKALGETLGGIAEIRRAGDEEAALERLAGDAIDLVLIDVEAPGLDAHALCRRLKTEKATREIPVILVAPRDGEDEAAGLALGALDYITRPLRPPVVRARVENLLALKRKTDLLERYARFDGLTCIPNRRRFERGLEQEWRRAARIGGWLAVVMIEIDRFEAFVEENGPVAGDGCTKLMAGVLSGAVNRAGELVARYGGQRFAALLPGIDVQAAVQAAEKMAEAVRRSALKHRSADADDLVTVSLGVAATRPRSHEDPRGLISVADQALAEARTAGGNRIEARITSTGKLEDY